MLPLTFFAGMLALTLVAFLAHLAVQRRSSRHLLTMAADWGMQYAQTDRFQLTAQVVERFPVPGVSDLAVSDLLYRQEADWYWYLFTVQYTEGVVRTKKRLSRVGTICEPRDRRLEAAWSSLELAPAGLSRLSQYAHLHGQPHEESSRDASALPSRLAD